MRKAVVERLIDGEMQGTVVTVSGNAYEFSSHYLPAGDDEFFYVKDDEGDHFIDYDKIVEFIF